MTSCWEAFTSNSFPHGLKSSQRWESILSKPFLVGGVVGQWMGFGAFFLVGAENSLSTLPPYVWLVSERRGYWLHLKYSQTCDGKGEHTRGTQHYSKVLPVISTKTNINDWLYCSVFCGMSSTDVIWKSCVCCAGQILKLHAVITICSFIICKKYPAPFSKIKEATAGTSWSKNKQQHGQIIILCQETHRCFTRTEADLKFSDIQYLCVEKRKPEGKSLCQVTVVS